MRTSLTALVLGATVALGGPAFADEKETVLVPPVPYSVGPVEGSTPGVYTYTKDEGDTFEESLAKCLEDDPVADPMDGDCDPST